MRYLGIDYGEKRIGLAVSDPEGRIAFPHSIVGDLDGVIQAAKREQVGGIVIGFPMPFSGSPGKAGDAVKKFAARLQEQLQLPIEFENEVLTTKLAERHTEGAPDASAAALILQSYLDRNVKS